MDQNIYGKECIEGYLRQLIQIVKYYIYFFLVTVIKLKLICN